MSSLGYITAGILLQSPQLLDDVKENAGKPDPVEDWKLKRKRLREVYRILLAKPREYGIQPQTVNWAPGQSGNPPLTKNVSLLVHDTPIIRWMQTHFHQKYTTLIAHAAFLEKYVSPVPYNQMPRTVRVPTESIATLAKYAIRPTGDYRSAVRLITLYLWYKFAGKKACNYSEKITPPNDIKRSSGMHRKTFASKKRDKFGVYLLSKSKSVKGGPNPRQFCWVKWNPTIPTTGVSQKELDGYNSQTTATPPDYFTDQVAEQLRRHNIYHPITAHQIQVEELPLVYSDGVEFTIPLIPGIVPALLTYLIPTAALHTWLKEGLERQDKNTNPSQPLNRGLYEDAETPFTFIEKEVNYIPLAAQQARLPARAHLARFLDNQNTIMQRGVPVDIPTLTSCQPSPKPGFSKKRQAKRWVKLLKRKYQIQWASKRGEGWYRGISRLESASERTYYHHFNPQSIPAEYREAIQSGKGWTFVYADVVSNDLSILFNLADDTRGMQLLGNQEDPYAFIADKALDHVSDRERARNKVKDFVNPWIYGAGEGTIVYNGDLNHDEYRLIYETIKRGFPKTVAWFDKLEKAVRTNSTIPKHLNPLDQCTIPTPPVFARRIAPTLLIQRTGATLMKHVVNYAMDDWDGIETIRKAETLLTVHDSILMGVPTVSNNPELTRSDLTECFRRARHRTPLKVINLRTGIGRTWHTAEQNAKHQNQIQIK